MTSQDALSTLDTLVPHLRQVGMSEVLNNPHHSWLLQLSSRLQGPQRQACTPCLTG